MFGGMLKRAAGAVGAAAQLGAGAGAGLMNRLRRGRGGVARPQRPDLGAIGQPFGGGRMDFGPSPTPGNPNALQTKMAGAGGFEALPAPQPVSAPQMPQPKMPARVQNGGFAGPRAWGQYFGG